MRLRLRWRQALLMGLARLLTAWFKFLGRPGIRVKMLDEILKLSPNFINDLATIVVAESNQEDFPYSRVDFQGQNTLLRFEWDRGCFGAEVASRRTPGRWAPIGQVAELIGVDYQPLESNEKPSRTGDLGQLRRMLKFVRASYGAIDSAFSSERIGETRERLEEISNRQAKRVFDSTKRDA